MVCSQSLSFSNHWSRGTKILGTKLGKGFKVPAAHQARFPAVMGVLLPTCGARNAGSQNGWKSSLATHPKNYTPAKENFGEVVGPPLWPLHRATTLEFYFLYDQAGFALLWTSFSFSKTGVLHFHKCWQMSVGKIRNGRNEMGTFHIPVRTTIA